jgi:Arc/MetJ family transcription regulator
MSTTIDHIEVPDEMIHEAMRRASTQEPKAALLEALRDFVRPRSQADLVKFLGTSDSFFTPEELDRMREIDS